MSTLIKAAGAALLLALLAVAYVVAQDRKVAANCEERSLTGGCALFDVSMIGVLANPDLGEDFLGNRHDDPLVLRAAHAGFLPRAGSKVLASGDAHPLPGLYG